MGGLSESIKNRKIRDENCLSDNVTWKSKNLWKMIPADVKAKVKQKEIKKLVAMSYEFLQKASYQNLKYNVVKAVCIFYLILVSITFSLTLSVKNREVGGCT